MRMGDSGGAIISGSVKQKLNTRSSTEAEIIAVDDFISKVLWTRNFLDMQQFPYRETTLAQDNTSAILLHEKGPQSAGKRMKHLNIRYYFTRDCISHGLLRLNYVKSQDLEADFLTKPLQGKAFLKFRDSILGLNNISKKVLGTGGARRGPGGSEK